MQKDCRTCTYSKFEYIQYCEKQDRRRIIDETNTGCPYYKQSFFNKLFKGKIETQADPRFIKLYGGCVSKPYEGSAND